MNHSLKHLGFASLALLISISAAQAADMPPPPVDDLRPATYDWTGPYVGVIGSGISTRGDYDTSCIPCGSYKREHNGWGWAGGGLAGWNYQYDSFVMGIEGNWQWGGRAARNRDPSERTKLKYRYIAMAKARLGWAMDDTLVYVSGGYAGAKTKFSTSDFPTGSGTGASDHKWANGWVIGGGMEHAFASNVSGRIEYNYMDLKNQHYKLKNSYLEVPIHHKFKGNHMMSVGLTYNFGDFGW